MEDELRNGWADGQWDPGNLICDFPVGESAQAPLGEDEKKGKRSAENDHRLVEKGRSGEQRQSEPYHIVDEMEDHRWQETVFQIEPTE